MCGIFGGIGPQYEPTKVQLLALLNQSRGVDAGGFFNETHYIKQVGPIKNLINHRLVRTKKNNLLVGHTRYATTGAKEEQKNAHPFVFNQIMGAHNGKVVNFYTLKAKYGIEQMRVDSEIIFWGLAHHGVGFLKELDAYWGLVWTDATTPGEVFLMQHEHELAAVCQKGAIYFSSDAEDLKRIGFTNPFKLKKDCIYSINQNTLRITKTKINGLRTYTPKEYTTTPTWWDQNRIMFPRWNGSQETTEHKEQDLLETKESIGLDDPLTGEEQLELDQLTDLYDTNLLPLPQVDRFEHLQYRAFKNTHPGNERVL